MYGIDRNGCTKWLGIRTIAGHFDRAGDALEQKLFDLRISESCEIDRWERGIEDSQRLVRNAGRTLSARRGRNLINVQPLKDHPAGDAHGTYFETAADALRNHSEELLWVRAAVRAIWDTPSS